MSSSVACMAVQRESCACLGLQSVKHVTQGSYKLCPLQAAAGHSVSCKCVLLGGGSIIHARAGARKQGRMCQAAPAVFLSLLQGLVPGQHTDALG